MGKIWLDRKILDWEWWSDINTYRLFTYCLLKANWKDSKFQGVDIPRGSFVTSLPNLAISTTLSVRQVRTSLEHLKTTGELTVIRHAKFSVVVVNNYNQYQCSDTQIDSQLTEERQSIDSQSTTIEEDKEVNNINNINNKRSSKEADELFEFLWSQYPFMKRGKGSVSTTQKKKILKVGKEQMLRCMQRFAIDMTGKDEQYIMRGSTFFNSGYIDYLDVNADSGSSLEQQHDVTREGYEVVTLDDM